jgi:hypothetical protein
MHRRGDEFIQNFQITERKISLWKYNDRCRAGCNEGATGTVALGPPQKLNKIH